MFLLSKLFQLVFKHANKEIWSNPKSVRKGLTTVIAEYAHANISDTDFNKYFSGKNKGRSLVGVVQDEIDEKGFSPYILEVEKRLSQLNYKENKFQLDSTLEDFFELLEESTNLSVSIQISLKKSYKLNHAIRPYLFVVECFYYALISYHQSNIAYKEVDFSQESQPISKPLESLISKAEGYSRRVIQELNKFSEEELALFRKVAPFTFYDESKELFSGEYVYDCYLISHADFEKLFTKYGVKGNDISRLIEYGLISGGGRHEIIVEIETDDEFFKELADSFKEKLAESDIEISVINIEELS
ncbi:hypothetical protein [Streptococcus sanguinis]|uniref:hypothetical protein n=1 Tax=Streptococcus sanguinis TaxID=1305 RepID=UPI002285351A|nr:hypothetical protein [Streptococcus sanguinis]MCY7019542.1 hypothetical protein [Streptococcus sanguinis]